MKRDIHDTPTGPVLLGILPGAQPPCLLHNPSFPPPPLPTDHINIYLAPLSAASSLLGRATFPWYEEAFTEMGGLFFNLHNSPRESRM